MHKKTITVAFSIFMTLGVIVSDVQAQDVNETSEEVIRDSEEEEGTPPIVWPELDFELAPLEEVTIPPMQRSNGLRGERQTYLQLEEPAPWDGVLFNPAAVAYLIAEVQAMQERAEAALERQRESDWNRIKLVTEQLQLRILSDRRRAEIVIEGLQRENERMAQIHEDYVDTHQGGFWFTKIGKAIKWGLTIIGVGAVAGVVGYVVGVARNP